MNNNEPLKFDPMTGQPLNNNAQINPVFNPTVEQNNTDFVTNTQIVSSEKKEEKKEKINYAWIIVLFIIMLVAIYFLFPLVAKNL